MKVIESIYEMKDISLQLRNNGNQIKLIPTMGSLHAGHGALIEGAARGMQPNVRIVSIFVNPLQFDGDDDFLSYPDSYKSDLIYCEQLGVDYVFVPTADILYVEGFRKTCKVSLSIELANELEGEARPGFLEGVLTIVCKLINICQPHEVFCGEKDYQELKLIAKMCHDLNFSIRVVAVPIVREPDNLPFSWRNARLSSDARQTARKIHQILVGIQTLIHTDTEYCNGELTEAVYCDTLHRTIRVAKEISKLISDREEKLELVYLVIRCVKHFSEIIFRPELDCFDCQYGCSERNINRKAPKSIDARLLISAKVENVRILDNVHLRLAISD